MKCKSRIVKTFTKAKSHSIFPIIPAYGTVNEAAKDLPECGGEVTVWIKAESDGCGCCGGGAGVVFGATCSKCRTPFVDYRLQNGYPDDRINELLTQALEVNE